MPYRDDQFIQRSKIGTPDSFMEIYEHFYPSVYRYIFIRISDRDCAEDLTAEVFVRLIAKFDTYIQRDRPLIAWLYTIAHNLVIDHYRSINQLNTISFSDDLTSGPSGHPEKLTEEQLSQECLAKSLQYLTEDQRQVILLRFIDEREIAEIAAILGKNERAIRSLQHRALATLHRVIEKEQCYES